MFSYSLTLKVATIKTLVISGVAEVNIFTQRLQDMMSNRGTIK